MKIIKQPKWKKGMIGRQEYVPPVILEANLTEEQKTWPRSDIAVAPSVEQQLPEVESGEPNPKTPPAA